MICFHCGATTELRVKRRPICASAECHLMALEAGVFYAPRVPPDMLAKVESGNITVALAHREHVASLYGELIRRSS